MLSLCEQYLCNKVCATVFVQGHREVGSGSSAVSST